MYLKVIVTPGAKRESVAEKGDALLIAVREPAERNLANTRVRELVALHQRAPLGNVRIVSGHRSRSKMLSVPDAPPAAKAKK